jgi:hypothetical protein
MYTWYAGPNQDASLSGVDILTINIWHLCGFSRSGTSVRIYMDGIDVTVTADSHANPASSAANNLYVGIYNDAAATPFDGYLWNPRIWGRALSPWEHRAIFDAERSLFGV